MKKGFSVFREDTLKPEIYNLCHGNKQKGTQKPQQTPFVPSHQNKPRQNKKKNGGEGLGRRLKKPPYLLALTLKLEFFTTLPSR